MGDRRCEHVGGMIVCGGPASAEDLAKLTRLRAIMEGGGTPGEAREAAGLTIGQAVRILGWSRPRLVAIEDGETMSSIERVKLMALYGVDGFAEVTRVG